MTEASKRPWRVFTNSSGTKVVGIGQDDCTGICDAGFGLWRWDDAEGIANANLIIRAVNNFDEMKLALVLAQKTLATLVNVEGIKHTTVINAYAQVVAAEAKARAVLAKIEE